MTYRSKPASQEVLSLYCLVGEGLSNIQHLEDALSHSVAIKRDVKIPYSIPKAKGDKVLAKYRSFTLGRVVGLAKKENLYPGHLLQELEEFLLERNWLVHKSVAQSRDEWDLNLNRNKLLRRIKSVSIQARKIWVSIEEDLMNFSEANGLDMSGVRASIKNNG